MQKIKCVGHRKQLFCSVIYKSLCESLTCHASWRACGLNGPELSRPGNHPGRPLLVKAWAPPCPGAGLHSDGGNAQPHSHASASADVIAPQEPAGTLALALQVPHEWARPPGPFPPLTPGSHHSRGA